jgi:predicted nucleic acid-binding protein
MAVVLEHVEVFADAPLPTSPMVKADPADDRLLLCAQTSAAAMIVTGDHHLLLRHRHLGIRFVTPTQALGTARATWKH